MKPSSEICSPWAGQAEQARRPEALGLSGPGHRLRSRWGNVHVAAGSEAKGCSVVVLVAWLTVLSLLSFSPVEAGGERRGAGPSGAAENGRVRVLIAESRGGVQVTPAGRSIVTIEPQGSGLQVDGVQTRSPWTSGGGDDVTTVDGLRVRGRVAVLRTGSGLMVVNDVPLDSYLAGTLGNEMYSNWHREALRAQAVVSRTYALHRAAKADRGAAFDLTAGTASQVYRGVESESEPVWSAVRATRGEILTSKGGPILAVFHSASGGRTAGSEEVWGEARSYLQSRKVEDEDDSPDTYWRAALSRTTLRRALQALGRPVGEIEDLEVTKRSKSGRVLEIRVVGSEGGVALTGRDLRQALGGSTLKSTLFEIQRSDDGFVIVGSGRGHGVGMSQWGARAMASRGAMYPEILEHFFPGALLEGAVLEESSDVSDTTVRVGGER